MCHGLMCVELEKIKYRTLSFLIRISVIFASIIGVK